MTVLVLLFNTIFWTLFTKRIRMISIFVDIYFKENYDFYDTQYIYEIGLPKMVSNYLGVIH